MKMDLSALLLSLKFSGIVVNKNCEDLTHAESLIHPEAEGHSFNWVLGHMVRTRNEILELLGKKPLFQKDKFSIYSPKGFDPGKALNMEELQASFNTLQDELSKGIQSLTPEKLRQPASLLPGEEPKDTIGSILATVLWHEAYHAGQLGIIRRTVGKPGKIKNPAGE
jgi:uncharacterized damage-inducible protein DinB